MTIAKRTRYILTFGFALILCSNAFGQIRINEIGYAGVDFQGASKWVEIHNEGADAVDVSTLWLCNFPAYEQIANVTVLSGNTTIPAGGYLIVAWDGIGVDDGEMGLYSNNDFGNADSMVDYMQYGSAGHQREGVAVAAQVWDPGAFVAASAAGQSLTFSGGGATHAEDWTSQDPTPGEANPGATAVPVRINELAYGGADFESAAKWVELFNAGDADVDVSSLWLCNFPAYEQIANVTVLSGNTTIPAGGYLVVAWDGIGVDDGEMGLYSSNDFGSADSMVDYMQYGSAGHQREGVAVTAGVWDAGGFVPAVTSGMTLSYFEGENTHVTSWGDGMPSAGLVNTDNAATPVERDEQIPAIFTLKGHYPEPFNPGATIQFDLNEAAQVGVVVYDLLGRERARLAERAFQPGANQRIQFEASQLPSGMYIYQVVARGFNTTSVQSGRMTLLK